MPIPSCWTKFVEGLQLKISSTLIRISIGSNSLLFVLFHVQATFWRSVNLETKLSSSNFSQKWIKHPQNIVSWVRFVYFLGQVMARQFFFKIYWPLILCRLQSNVTKQNLLVFCLKLIVLKLDMVCFLTLITHVIFYEQEKRQLLRSCFWGRFLSRLRCL